MMHSKLLKEYALDDRCAYIEGYRQTTHYKLIDECSKKLCGELIERGWRRFGKVFFRPICPHCEKCESIKIDVENFTFNKSKRRVLKKAAHLRTKIQKPSVTDAHIELFNTYHAYMQERKGWEEQSVTPQSYYGSFVHGYNDFGYEILYFDDDKLIAVDLIDILDEGISSIYFYYDPAYAKYSLGNLSIYKQVDFAKALSLRWIYLGYYVAESKSLSYKANYMPYLTLQGRPREDEPPVWI